MIHYEVPFYAARSSRDGNCVSSVFKMVLSYFVPRKWTWDEVNRLTGYTRGKGTWFFPGLTKLVKMGFETGVVDTFDYRRAYREGRSYLVQYSKNPEVLRWCLAMTDFPAKRKFLPEFVKVVRPKRAIPQISDIEKHLKAGYLVAVELNSTVLHGEEGEYISHLVLVVGLDKNNLLIHDPDIPPKRENWSVGKELFEKAWSYEGQNSHNITAFKYV